MKEKNLFLKVIVGIVLIASLLFLFKFFLFEQTFFEKSYQYLNYTDIDGFNMTAKSTKPFGSFTTQQVDTNDKIQRLTEKNLINNGIELSGVEYNENGAGAGIPDNLKYSGAQTVILSNGLNLSTTDLDMLEIGFTRVGSAVGNAGSGGGNSQIYLTNSNNDVSLFSGLGSQPNQPGTSESHILKLEVVDDIMYLSIDSNKNVLNINNESYELVFVSYTTRPGVGDTTSVAEKLTINSLSITYKQLEDVNTTINIYRFENNQCALLNIKESEKTSNDYLTLQECENNIEEETQNQTVDDTNDDSNNATNDNNDDNTTDDTNEDEKQDFFLIRWFRSFIDWVKELFS